MVKGGDVFLSTFVSYGCSSGYYGAQMHWNTMKMNLDWAMWDSGPHAPGKPITHPINPTDKQGRPTDRKGNLCSVRALCYPWTHLGSLVIAADLPFCRPTSRRRRALCSAPAAGTLARALAHSVG